jgi:hypothetical protein
MSICLRIIDALSGAYRNVEENWCIWMKLIMAPLILYTACMAIANAGINLLSPGLVQLVFSLLAIIFLPMMVVNIYRYGILGDYKDTWLNVRFDMPVWRVLLYTILMILISAIAIAAIGGAVGGVYALLEDVGITAGAGFVGGLLYLYFMCRCLFLLIPAVAIGEKHPFKKVFAITRGQVLYVFFTYVALLCSYVAVFVLLGIPFAVAGGVVGSLLFLSDALALWALGVIGTLYMVLCVLYIIAVSSKLYSNVYLECEKSSKGK